MSETEYWKGKLTKIEAKENESIEDTAKRLLGGMDILKTDYYDTYVEYIKSECYNEILLIDGVFYKVDASQLDSDMDIANIELNSDGTINFVVSFYNGSCGLDDALEDAMKDVKEVPSMWIDVNDEKPIHDQEVITYSRDMPKSMPAVFKMGITRYTIEIEGEREYFYGGSSDGYPITHWMPRPLTPEGR